jgi:hypothetical protein
MKGNNNTNRPIAQGETNLDNPDSVAEIASVTVIDWVHPARPFSLPATQFSADSNSSS